MPKKKPKEGKPKVHKDLEGLEITINEFGEIKSNVDVDKLNKFLNKNVEDKKLVDRDDLEDLMADEEDPDLDPNEMEDIEDDDLENLAEEEEDED